MLMRQSNGAYSDENWNFNRMLYQLDYCVSRSQMSLAIHLISKQEGESSERYIYSIILHNHAIPSPTGQFYT